MSSNTKSSTVGGDVPQVQQDTITISLAKYKALRGLISQKCSFLQVKVVSVKEDQTKGSLTLKGSLPALQQAKLSIYEELMNVEEQLVDVQLTPELSSYLQSTHGEDDVEGRLSGLRAQVVEVSGKLSIVGHVKDCSKAANIIRSLLHTETIEFPIAKYKALELKIKERCGVSNVRIVSTITNEMNTTVLLTIEAPKAAVAQFEVFFKGKMLELEERLLQLNSEKSGFLRTPKGKAKLDDLLQGLNVQVVPVGRQLVCVGSENGCSQAVTLIDGMFYKETVVCHLAKYIVLEEKILEKCSSLYVRIVSVVRLEAKKKAQVVLEATREVLDEAKMFIYETLMGTEEQTVPPEIECFLRDTRPVSKGLMTAEDCKKSHARSDPTKKTKDKEKTSKAHVVELQGRFSLVGSPEDCLASLNELKGRLCSKKIKLLDCFQEFMGTETWPAALQAVRSDGFVHVEIKESDIELFGTEYGVNDACSTLKKILETNSFTTGFIAIEEAVYEFIQLHCQELMENLQSKFGIEAETTTHGNNRYMQLRGNAHSVIQAKAEMETWIVYQTLGLPYQTPEKARYFLYKDSPGYASMKQLAMGTNSNYVIDPQPRNMQQTPSYRDLTGVMIHDPDVASLDHCPASPRDQQEPDALMFLIRANSVPNVTGNTKRYLNERGLNYGIVEQSNPYLDTADDEDIASLLSLGSPYNMMIEIDQKTKTVKAFGDVASVPHATTHFQGVFDAMKKKRLVKHCPNAKQTLQAKLLEEQLTVPSYWTKNRGESAKLMVMHNPSMAGILVDLDVGEQLHGIIHPLLVGCWKHGNSNFTQPFGYQHSLKVQRIENPVVYQEYRKRLRLACEEGSKTDFAHITTIAQEEEIATAALEIAELDGVRLREVNEYFLFVKCSSVDVERIVTQGLKVKDVTFSENSADVVSYEGGGYPYEFVVVCRVILGHIYRDSPRTDQYGRPVHGGTEPAHTAPPCRVPGCHSDRCPHVDRFSSVMIKSSNHINRQFLLFDDFAAYPEFLVTHR